jgi:hypothetical protein
VSADRRGRGAKEGEIAAMDEARPRRHRFRLGTLLFVVAILALVLIVVIQQVQIGRQQAQIRQMRREIDRHVVDQVKLTEIIRELRDLIERTGRPSERHR